MKPHKFKHNQNREVTNYSTIVYCEYCGLVIYDANRSSTIELNFERYKIGCPHSPENETHTYS